MTNQLKGNFPRGQFPGAYLSIIFGVIVREQSSRGQLSRSNYPGGNFPRGHLSGEQKFVEHFSSEAIILGGNYPGCNNPGINHPGGQFSSEVIFR